RREHESARARGGRVARQWLRDTRHGDVDPRHGRSIAGSRPGIHSNSLIGLGAPRYHWIAMTIADSLLKTRRWTRMEYERLVDYGLFRSDEHLELLDGLLVVREPQGSRHSAAVAAVSRVLARAFGDGFHVRPQLPLALDDASEPEP